MKTVLMMFVASLLFTTSAYAGKHHSHPASRDSGYSSNPTSHLPDAILDNDEDKAAAEETVEQPEGTDIPAPEDAEETDMPEDSSAPAPQK